MNIDDLTYGDLKKIAALFSGNGEAKNAAIDDHLIGKPVIIRTYSAGVHFGILDARNGAEVRLRDTRRIWYWEKAFTLSQVSQDGVGGNTKMPAAIPEIILTECVEILPCSEKAAECLRSYNVHEV